MNLNKMTTDFTPITSLRLRQLYDKEAKFTACVSDEDLLSELFEVTKRGQIFVCDNKQEGHSTFIKDSSGHGKSRLLKVTNPKCQDLFLWHIDGILYKRNSKCDCALINTSSLCFVEFKSEAQNRTQAQAGNIYEVASGQIRSVLCDFLQRAESIHFDVFAHVKIRAVAVFNKTVPAYNASQKAVKRKFEKTFNNLVPLDFTNEIKL